MPATQNFTLLLTHEGLYKRDHTLVSLQRLAHSIRQEQYPVTQQAPLQHFRQPKIYTVNCLFLWKW